MRENAGHFWPRNIVKILSTLECAWQISWLQEKIWDQIRNTGVGGKRRYHVGVLKQLKRLVRAWCREQDAAFRGHKELRLDDSLLWQWIFNSASIAVWESAGKNRVKWDINMKQLIKMFMSWVQKMMFWLEKKSYRQCVEMSTIVPWNFWSSEVLLLKLEGWSGCSNVRSVNLETPYFFCNVHFSLSGDCSVFSVLSANEWSAYEIHTD